MRRSTVVGAGLVSLLLAMPASASEESRECSAGKLKAMTKAFRCLGKDDRKVAAGADAHPERCAEKLQGFFERLEEGGACPTVGDHGDAFDLVYEAEQSLVEVAAFDPDVCSSLSLSAASKYAACMTAWRLKGIKRKEMLWNDLSYTPFPCQFAFTSFQPSTACSPGFDAVKLAVQQYYSYLPGMDFSSFKLRDDFGFGDLSGADFSNAEFISVDFAGADLSYANFTGVTGYGGARMNGANLTGVDLSTSNVDMFNAVNLSGCPAALPAGWYCVKNSVVGPTAWLTYADLTGADLTGVNLNNADFEQADLSGANLSGVDLANAGLWFTNLTGANLTGALLTHAAILGTIFDGADLTGVDLSMGSEGTISARHLIACPAALPSHWTCLLGSIVGAATVMDDLDLSGLDLSGRSFEYAEMRDTDLSNSNLYGTDLFRARLVGTDLTGANLTGADVYDAHLVSCIWSATICPDGTLSDNNVGATCCGHNVGGDPHMWGPAECID